MLDLVEEPLDAIVHPIEMRAEADRFPTIAFRWDIGPRPLFVDECPDPAGIATAISKQHGSRSKTSATLNRVGCHQLDPPL